MDTPQAVFYILCIQREEAGGALWLGVKSSHLLRENTVLRCSEASSLWAEKNRGGAYILLVRPSEEKKSIEFCDLTGESD